MADANWANRTVFTGDNLDVLRGMDSETVDLIYADPPFGSNKHYAAPIGSEAAGAAFKDTWTLSDIDDAWLSIIRDQHPGPHAVIEAAGVAHSDGMKSYLCMMAIRLLELHRVLKPTGSLFLHCDPTANSYLRLLLDSIFGRSRQRNEIVWCYTSPGSPRQKQFSRRHDTILWYSKGKEWVFNADAVRVPHSEKTMANFHDGLSGSGFGNEGYELPEKGKIPETWWTKFSQVRRIPKERVGFPTQNPLALLERIIAASSNPDDVVLDPFCGCATALVAAEKLTRQWVGIDIAELAVKLVRKRLKREVPLFTQDAIDRNDVPLRTDLVDEVREYLNEKRALYGSQEGRCGGCRVHFELRNMEVDHVVPRVKGGPDHITNYQLLCSSCNRRKGSRSQAELIAKLKRDGIIAA